MPYADLAAVKARAGKLSGAWSTTSTPSDANIESFLGDVAAEIDALISSRGFATPVAAPAADALRGLNADGALAIALVATWPDDDGPTSAKAQKGEARKRYEKGIEALGEGTHPAIVLLESGDSAATASSLWTDDPDYGITQPPETNPHLAPGFARSMKL